MATRNRKYKNSQKRIGWDRGSAMADSIDDGWVLFEVAKDGIDIEKFDPPTLTRKNVTDLRDWLTAWLERTER